jgi:tetratricopeptide (TPR) repeat protein
MDSNILQFNALLRRDRNTLASTSGNETYSRHIDNLEGCMRSVKKIVSAASSVVGSLSESSSAVLDGSQASSKIGSLFTDGQRRAVENWILQPTIYETEYEHDPEPATSQTEHSLIFTAITKETTDTQDNQLLNATAAEASDSDMEADMIEHWQKKGRHKLSHAKYSEAASYLEKALERAEARHDRKTDFEGRDGTLELLATAYYHQNKLKNVEEIMNKFGENYPGKLRTLDMLISAHCEQNEWEEAEKLILKQTDTQTRDQRLRGLALRCSKESQWNVAKDILLKHTSFEGRNKVLKLVASECYQKSELTVAEELLHEHVKCMTEGDVQCLESLHILADLYLQMGELESAVTYGKRALEGRKKIFGRRHTLFFESVFLIVKIYIAKGDMIEADGYTALVPPSHDYFSKLQGKLH